MSWRGPSKLLHATKRLASTMKTKSFDREKFEQLVARRFFYAPSFHIYGGVAGLYDLGPPGCALQSELLSLWRKHFIMEEDMLEIDAASLTPHSVLQTSGHVERFCDAMVKDSATGAYHRADHLIEAAIPHENEILAKLDGMSLQELGSVINEFNIKSPETGNDLESPTMFNLMFPTTIGPTTQTSSFMRPETAQGHFVNFKKLLEFNNGQVPFASAQIGKAFRNEISPRGGLLRVREFLMAEVEHYIDPDNKDHPRVSEVSDHRIRIWRRGVQEAGMTREAAEDITIADAIKEGVINSETMAYFLARIKTFLLRVGIDEKRLLFRQHKCNELSHYAEDCWDAEVLTSHGWIEVVGCADRSAYDLSRHQESTGAKLVVQETLDQPVTREVLKLDIKKKVFGPRFRKDAKEVENLLTSLDSEGLASLKEELEEKGQSKLCDRFTVDRDIVSVEHATVTEHVREFVPNVIEPSFGIGRILYSIMEHSYWIREGSEQRNVLSFPPAVAPIKCLVVPLSNNAQFKPFVKEISMKLRGLGISSRVDDSSSAIGRRYSRNDELGTPFGITIDFQTVKDGTVTLRERDSTKQIREQTDRVLELVKSLVAGSTRWEEVLETHPAFESQDA